MTESRVILGAWAFAYLRSGPRGWGTIELRDDGICWMPRWARVISKFHLLVKWMRSPLFIGLDEITSLEFVDQFMTPLLRVQTNDEVYELAISMNWRSWRADRELGKEWFEVLRTRWEARR